MTTSSLDVELLLGRLLSASTPSDCLDSLEQLQQLCRCRLRKGKKSKENLNSESSADIEEDEEEIAEKARQANAIDALLANHQALHALCSLIAQTTLPSQNEELSGDGGQSSPGMEVEGGDVAACELLLEMLPSSSLSSLPTSTAGKKRAGGTSSAALKRQREEKRRMEYISKTLLHFQEHESSNDKSSALIPSLLDCLCATNATNPPSTYARVLSLQILQSLLTASPGALREQLTNAPDGINRLVDLLGHGADGAANLDGEGVPEEVRNQALLLLTSLASSSSMLARLITFSEGYDRALQIALEHCEDGLGLKSLRGGSSVPIDCLQLCLALARADDATRELFLEGGDGMGKLDRLAMLLDLRGGERFCEEDRNLWWEEEMARRRKAKMEERENDTGGDTSGAGSGRKMAGEKPREDKKSGKRNKHKEDDLDDILRGITSGTDDIATTKSKPDTSKGPDQSETNLYPKEQRPPVPYLIPNESSIFNSVLELLLLLLYDGDYNPNENLSAMPLRTVSEASRPKRRARAKKIMSHKLLSQFIVDCAVFTLPPIDFPFICAVPPPEVQRLALVTVAGLGSLGGTAATASDVDNSSRTDGKETKAADFEKARKKKEEEEEMAVQTQLLFDTMPIYLEGRATAIDRLLFIVCTGAYQMPMPFEKSNSEKDDFHVLDEESAESKASLLSMHALSALRATLPSETASRMVLHALAPPPPDEADEMGSPVATPPVINLAITLANNLRFIYSQQHRLLEEHASDDGNITLDMNVIYSATICAVGAANALGVFLTKGEGDATREMLLRLPPPPAPTPMHSQSGGADDAMADPLYSGEAESNSLIDFILQHVASYDPSVESINPKFHASTAHVTLTLLRLLSEWVTGMPKAVSEVLSSPSSVSIGVLVRSAPKKKVGAPAAGPSVAEAVPAMSGLLLGLCLEYLSESSASSSNTSSASSSADLNIENAAWTQETILNMIQSMGVAKYLNTMEEWKKRPLPLPYCSVEHGSYMERLEFASWYGQSVASVRRRIVLALSGSGEDDDGESDSEDDGGVANEASKTSIRSLRKMLTNQSQEMEKMQSKLEESMRTIAEQSTQIKELKRVAEMGTSSDFNDMLSEYTDKVAELEKQKQALLQEAEKQSKLNEETIAAKDQEISKIQEDLQQKQMEVEEVQREKEILSEEMEGLSAAYNALEQDYNNTSRTNSMTPTELTAGGEVAAEDGDIRGHSVSSAPGGETAAEHPSRGDNHQLQLLREENARLSNDVRAANEWMNMAVNKMQEMESDNESLSRSLEELRVKAQSNADAGSSSNQQLDSLRSELKHLRLESESSRIALESDIESKRNELAQQQTLIQELQDRIQQMGQPSTNVETATELDNLRQANKDAQEWMASAVTHIEKLTSEVEELKSKNAELSIQSELSAAKGLSESNENMSALESKVKSLTSERDELQNELNLAKDQLAVVKSENEEVLRTNEESSAKQISNNEALQSQLDELDAQNKSIVNERDELQIKLSEFQAWSETAQNRMAEMEIELQQASAQRDDLNARLQLTAVNKDTNDATIQQLESLKEQLREKDTEIEDVRMQLDRVQSQLIDDAEKREAEIEMLRTDLENEKQKCKELGQQCVNSSEIENKLFQENEELKSSLARTQAEIDSLNANEKDLKLQLEESQRRIVNAEAQVDQLIQLDHGKANNEDEIIALTAERNQIQSQLDDINEEYEVIRKSLERTDMENGNLMARNRALEQDNKSLEFQFAEASAKCSQLVGIEDQLKEKDRLLIITSEDKNILQQELEELKDSSEEAVQLWKERSEELERNVSDLENQMDLQEKEATETIAQWEARCSALEEGEDVIRQWQERSQSMEAEIESLEKQIELKDSEAAEVLSEWQTRCLDLESKLKANEDSLKDLSEKNSSLDECVSMITSQMKEARDSCADLEQQLQTERQMWTSNQSELNDRLEKAMQNHAEMIQALKLQIEEKDDTIEALTNELLETRDQSEQVVNQWQERSNQLERNISELEEAIIDQQHSANDAIAQWEARCGTLNEKIEGLELQLINYDPNLIASLEEKLSLSELQLAERSAELSRFSSELEALRLTVNQKEGQVSSLEANLESSLEQLEDTRNKLDRLQAEHGLLQQTLSHKETEYLDQSKILSQESMATVTELEKEIERLTSKLDSSLMENEDCHKQIKETKGLLTLRVQEWEEKEILFKSQIEQLDSVRADLESKLDVSKTTLSENTHSLQNQFDRLKEKCHALENEKARLSQESEESKVVVYELQEELRSAKDELQQISTDQFSAKATEMATQALRQQVVEIRSQYAADQKSLTKERESRIAAEEEVTKLKSNLALLAQAKEYDDSVDVHVRRIAKKMSAENVRKERKEMEELRMALERLREELGSCRWKEREAEERAANARLQQSILEQEVYAAKSDLTLMEKAMEELENSKIDMHVSLEYHIEELENERETLRKSHEEEIGGIKSELARVNQEKERLAHKVEQCEKANAALVYSTSHDGPNGDEIESEVIKLQLERAQLLAKITEMGADAERRTREAVAARASSAEAELILEKESRRSVESSLSDALSELDETKALLMEETTKNKKDKHLVKEEVLQKLRETLQSTQEMNEELQHENQLLQDKIDESDKENKVIIKELREKINQTEEKLRSEERQSRFEAALATEISNLRGGAVTSVNGSHTHSQSLVLRGMDQNAIEPKLLQSEDGKDAIDRNSIYIIEMYDYVVELKKSIQEERQLYKELLAEHEELLALLGQSGWNGLNYNVCE